MKKCIYSSDIQSGGFWNELAAGEFLSGFFSNVEASGGWVTGEVPDALDSSS